VKYVYLDCEFVPDDLSFRGLVSIAVTDGETSFYAVNSTMDTRRVCSRGWMVENVWRHIPSLDVGVLDLGHRDVKSPEVIRESISGLFEDLCPSGNAKKDLKLVALCGGQDIVRLHGLWNHDWSVMPKWIPRYLHDLQEDLIDAGLTDDDLPQQDPATEHHALYDALYDKTVQEAL
jgi:hypothetical protein